MPDPPAVSLITHYLFEVPWIPGGVLLVIGLVAAWAGLREGRSGPARVGAGLLGLAVICIVIGMLVTTSGERARVVTRALAAAIENNDLVGLDALLASDAKMSMGSPNNPGIVRAAIIEAVSDFNDRRTISSNSIRSLDSYSTGSDHAIVHLACLSETEAFPYPTPTSWVLRIDRQPDDSWRASRITCVSVAGEPPPSWR